MSHYFSGRRKKYAFVNEMSHYFLRGGKKFVRRTHGNAKSAMLHLQIRPLLIFLRKITCHELRGLFGRPPPWRHRNGQSPFRADATRFIVSRMLVRTLERCICRANCRFSSHTASFPSTTPNLRRKPWMSQNLPCVSTSSWTFVVSLEST